MRLQEASWAYLGPIWVAKGGPRGGLLEAKLSQGRDEKREEKVKQNQVKIRGEKGADAKTPLGYSKAGARGRGDRSIPRMSRRSSRTTLRIC